VQRAGEPVRLSTTEFELLVYLLQNRGRVLSREQILRAVWGYEYDPGTNVVDVYIGYRRRKLRYWERPAAAAAVAGATERRTGGWSEGGWREPPIVTVRSVGYRFDGAD
jgi:DNA-binding response OmpR family regulator